MISSGNGIQKIVVRGLSGLRVVTYLNGMQINNQQWANDHGIGFSEIGLDEAELIKGWVLVPQSMVPSYWWINLF